MEQFTIAQRLLIVKTFYQNGGSYAATVRGLRAMGGSPGELSEERVTKEKRK